MRPHRTAVLLVSAITLAALLAGRSPETADAGGTAVLAPSELERRDCRLGSRPEIEGYPPPSLIVLGCIRRGERKFLVAADGGDPFTCFYVAPEAGEDVDGVCLLPREGLDPPRFRALAIDRDRERDRVFGWGLASGAEDGVTLVGTGPGGKDRRRHSSLLRVGSRTASRVGVEAPFTIHLAIASSDARTCDGIWARVWDEGEPRGLEFTRESRRFGSGISLPGDPDC